MRLFVAVLVVCLATFAETGSKQIKIKIGSKNFIR